MCRRRLVPRQNEADAGLAERVEERHDLAARHAEGLADAEGVKRARDEIGDPRRVVRRGPPIVAAFRREYAAHGAPIRSSRSFTTRPTTSPNRTCPPNEAQASGMKSRKAGSPAMRCAIT